MRHFVAEWLRGYLKREKKLSAAQIAENIRLNAEDQARRRALLTSGPRVHVHIDGNPGFIGGGEIIPQ